MTTPGDPRVLLQRVQQLEQAGRLAEAESVYIDTLSRRPDLANTWYNLARLQKQLGKFDAALQSYHESLHRGVSQPEEVHLNRAVIYSDCLHRSAAAEMELDTALRLNPRYIPALFNLANLREDHGKRDAALALYGRILELDPRHFEALARYANVATPSDVDDPLIARLRAAIGNSAAEAERASLGFALGKSLDAVGAYDDAFAAYVAANRSSRASASPAPVYDRARQEQFADALMKIFSSRQAVAATATSTPQPIFICGMFRSGSTLTEQILATHPAITSGGELDLVPGIAKSLAPFPASMHVTTPQKFKSLAARYLDTLAQLFPGATLVSDKRPDNFLYIGLIKQLFPTARIIHTTRQPLDNCLSVYFLHLDHGMSYALDLMDTAHYYVQQQRLLAHWRKLYGEDILEFDYDAFVRDPEAARARLFSFCGLQAEQATASFEQLDNAVRTASVWQVRQPVYRSSSGRWRNYASHLREVDDYLREATPSSDAPTLPSPGDRGRE
jgi:tetratricopeptide (TPR) repeat protein